MTTDPEIIKARGHDCEVCGYRVRRRTRCKECKLLTCGYCLGTYHCPNTTDHSEDAV